MRRRHSRCGGGGGGGSSSSSSSGGGVVCVEVSPGRRRGRPRRVVEVASEYDSSGATRHANVTGTGDSNGTTGDSHGTTTDASIHGEFRVDGGQSHGSIVGVDLEIGGIALEEGGEFAVFAFHFREHLWEVGNEGIAKSVYARLTRGTAQTHLHQTNHHILLPLV